MAGGFFLGPDHHPKTDTNSTPELAKWLQVSEKVFHCCYSKSCDPKYQGFFGLVMGIAPSAGSERATPHKTPRGTLLFVVTFDRVFQSSIRKIIRSWVK